MKDVNSGISIFFQILFDPRKYCLIEHLLPNRQLKTFQCVQSLSKRCRNAHNCCLQKTTNVLDSNYCCILAIFRHDAMFSILCWVCLGFSSHASTTLMHIPSTHTPQHYNYSYTSIIWHQHRKYIPIAINGVACALQTRSYIFFIHGT